MADENMPSGTPKYQGIASINDDFDVSTLPDFDTCLSPENSEIDILESVNTVAPKHAIKVAPKQAIKIAPINISAAKVDDQYSIIQSRTRSPAIASGDIISSTPHMLQSSRTSLAEWMDIDSKTFEVDDQDECRLYTAVSGSNSTISNTQINEQYSNSIASSTKFISDEHKDSDTEESESDSEDDPLYMITPRTAAESALSDDNMSQLSLDENLSEVLWGKKLTAIPTKHGKQQIVEWKFAIEGSRGYRGHCLVLQHQQIKKKRRSKRKIWLDGKVVFEEKTKQMEWNELQIPFSTVALDLVIEAKDEQQLLYEYRLQIDGISYAAAFEMWQKDQH